MSSSSSSSIKERLREKIKQRVAASGGTGGTGASGEEKRELDPLFDNPMFVEMKKNLPIEEQKRYEEIGKQMYGNLENDFNEKGEMTAAVEMVAQIRVMLQSGLHPSYLTREEKEFLTNYIGKEWYLEFGFLEADVNRVNM